MSFSLEGAETKEGFVESRSEDEEEEEESLLMSLKRHLAYSLPHGTLQFLLAAPVALIPALRSDKNLSISGAGIDLALGFGTAANALGKACNGPTVDAVGALRFALFALFGAVIMVAGFSLALSRITLLGTYILLQFAASGGWLIGCKVIHDTFGKANWARNFAALSVASRAASIASKLSLGAMLSTSLSWQHIGMIGALLGMFLTLVAMRLLREVSELHNNKEEDSGQIVGPGGTALTGGGAEEEVVQNSEENQRKGFKLLLRDPGLLLYSGVCAGGTCVAACENLTPVLIGDLSRATPSHVTIAATAFPAGLLSAVLILPPVLAYVDRRGFFPRLDFNSLRLVTEILLLSISITSALALATLAGRSRYIPIGVLVILVYCLAFGTGFTFYITPNVYALEFGGSKDCATASAILDTFGLTASFLWNFLAGAIRRAVSNKFQTWYLTMLILALIIFVTASLSIIAAFHTGTVSPFRSNDDSVHLLTNESESLVVVGHDVGPGLRSRVINNDDSDEYRVNSTAPGSYFGLQQQEDTVDPFSSAGTRTDLRRTDQHHHSISVLPHQSKPHMDDAAKHSLDHSRLPPESGEAQHVVSLRDHTDLV